MLNASTNVAAARMERIPRIRQLAERSMSDSRKLPPKVSL